MAADRQRKRAGRRGRGWARGWASGIVPPVETGGYKGTKSAFADCGGRDAVFVSLDGKHEGFIERGAFGEAGVADLREGTRLLARVVDAGGGRDGAPKLVPLAVRGEEGHVEAVAPVAGGGAAAAAAGPVIVEGLRVKGAVTRVERYGVFVQITGTQGRAGRGLVPAAELGTPRNADLRKLFPVGAPIEAKVVRIEDDGKIRLSVIALRDDEEQAAYREHRKQSSEGGEGAAAAAPRAPGQKPAPRSFGTLGDLLNARRKPGGLRPAPARARPRRAAPRLAGPSPAEARRAVAPSLGEGSSRRRATVPPGRAGPPLAGRRRRGTRRQIARRPRPNRRAPAAAGAAGAG
ncbi:MAG TPA: S1 RNA-binding domain-containing protein, partial [Polyangiaceae bacterium]|nr:S1 RNA-binding domain-containing protein [Polyangiaceae bacterium]